jgi:CheY-like chemotaxis protein
MKTILVIDDDVAVQVLFEQVLQGIGYNVIIASNGREGMRYMHEHKPDLIITDIMMPDMDGLEILMELRAEFREVPVIAISGGMRAGSFSFLPHAKKMGASRIFEKPVDMDVLLKNVAELLATPAAG